MTARRDLLLEIGVEEIPSGPLYGAIEQLTASVPRALDDARLSYEAVEVFGAPRRIVVRAAGLAEAQEARTLRLKGPAAKAAFDAEGKPTKAAEGFARGKGVGVEDLVTEKDDSGEYVYAVIDETGGETMQVLPALLERLISGLDWPKSQRWGGGEVRFVRPLRWLLALFGAEVVPVSYAGLTAGRVTWGHRFLAPGPIEVPAADEYSLASDRGRFVYDQEERARFLRESIESAAGSAGGLAVVPEKTFAEVVNLVEYPTVGVGRFDEDFLTVPREVLENAMESHQRYFPVESEDGSLLPCFIVAHNGDPERTDAIVRGHERVIRARLADAAFFYREDLAHPLEAYLAKLSGITFQEKLGTLAAKVERVERLTAALAELAGAAADETAWAVRAAHLCKADLVTAAVVEFPALQGVMGHYYALSSEEAPEVAAAIVEHYQPRFAGDALPSSLPGRLVAVADKLDTIVGIFAIGMAPKGSADPYALRRGALGILGMIVDQGLDLRLTEAIAAALGGYAEALPGLDREAVGAQVREFILGRLQTVMKDRGHVYDTVDAVLAISGDDPRDALARADALTNFRTRQAEAAEDLSVAFTRAKNLSKPDLGVVADEEIMGPEERTLARALADAESAAAETWGVADHTGTLEVLASLRAPIDAFFEAVLVMDPDEALRDNRLRLLNRFVALFSRFADFSKLVG